MHKNEENLVIQNQLAQYHESKNIDLDQDVQFYHQNKLRTPHKDFDHTLHNMPFPEQGHLLVLANATALFSDFKTARPYTNKRRKNEC